LRSKHLTLAGNPYVEAALKRLLAAGSSAEDGCFLELDDAAAALVAAAALSARALSCSWEVPRKSAGTCRKFVLTCFDYFVHILLCVPLHANAHALDGWNSSLKKSGPTRWRPQLLLCLLLGLCQFPFVFAIVQQRRAAFSGPPEWPSAASAPHLPCWGKQAGLKNHGAGNPWDRGPSMMLSEINGCKLMTFEPFCRFLQLRKMQQFDLNKNEHS